MAKYICKNCGYMQNSYGSDSSGCANAFWITCLIFTFLIAIFVPVAWVVVGFEILFVILTSGKKETNKCHACNAKDCVVPLNTPAGEKIYDEFYEDDKQDSEN